VSGGIDAKVKLWEYKDNQFDSQKELEAHEDWVRDVTYSNNIGFMQDMKSLNSSGGI